MAVTMTREQIVAELARLRFAEREIHVKMDNLWELLATIPAPEMPASKPAASSKPAQTWEWYKRGAWCLDAAHPTKLMMKAVDDGYVCKCGNVAPGRDWDSANNVGVPLGTLKGKTATAAKPEAANTTVHPKWQAAKDLGLCWRGCGAKVTTGNLCDACRALKKAGK